MEITKVSQNAGELSGRMAGRADLSKYHMGSELAENVFVGRTGEQYRRAGFEFIDTEDAGRLEGFNFSGDQGMILHFGDETLRFYKGTSLVESLATPWGIEDVFQLDFAQRNNVIIITHPGHEPQLLIRAADDDWSLTAFPWVNRIWQIATDDDTLSLTPAATTGATTITASSSLFDASWVGSRLRLEHKRDESQTTQQFNTVFDGLSAKVMASDSLTDGDEFYFNEPGVFETAWTCIADYDHTTDYSSGDDHPSDYPAFFQPGAVAIGEQEVRGEWSFETYGTWKGILHIERSYNGGVSWETVKVCQSDNDKNFNVIDQEREGSGASFRVMLINGQTDEGDRFVFTVKSATVGGVAVITAYNSATEVAVTVEEDFEEASATTDWQEDAFNPRNGYPCAVTFHQKRLVFGGSTARQQEVWLSRTQEPYDFTQGTLATDGMTFQLDSSEYEEVAWLASGKALLVGTSSAEWAILAPDGISLSPESNAALRQSSHGSEAGLNVRQVQAGILFIQRKMRKVREMSAVAGDFGTFEAPDLTQLAEHICRSGVIQTAKQEVPDSRLLLVLGSGEIAALTYERAEQVVGWTRLVTDGTVESIATCNGAGEEDEIWIIVDRNGTRTLERMNPDSPEAETEIKMDSLRFLDSYVAETSETASETLSGLDHLEGLEVRLYGDGEDMETATVTGGEVTFPEAKLDRVAGLTYASRSRPMPLGNIGDKISPYNVIVRVWNTLGLEVEHEDDSASLAEFVDAPVLTNSPLPLKSGDFLLTPPSTHARQSSITILQRQPYPMTLLGVRIQTRR